MTEKLSEGVWYSSVDAAEIIGVNKRTVHAWIKRGDLPALAIGGRTGYRISESAIEQFLQNRRVTTTAKDELTGANTR